MLRSQLRAVRLPGAWDVFEVAVHRVLRRHVGAAGARDAVGRLARALGRPLAACPPAGPDRLFPEPEALAAAGPRVLGLSAAAARDLRRLGEATAGGAIHFQTATFHELGALLEHRTPFHLAPPHWIAIRSPAGPDALHARLQRT